MSNAVLEKDKNNSLGGIVLTSTGPGWKRPTGVFVPDPSILADRWLTVLLWFHGYYIKDIPALFYKEDTKLLQSVINSNRRIVVIAPHLGWFKTKKDTDYNAAALGRGGKSIEQYLDQVLNAMSDWYVSTQNDAVKQDPPKYQIGNLILGGHSGGGGGISSAVTGLGSYADSLRECWGFDCLYGSGATWYEWAKARGRMPLYFYFGLGTRPADNADVLGFWKRVYGTPKNPLPLGARMLNVYLAPALPGAELDMVAFQFSEDIKRKTVPGSRYEEVRKLVDPLLDEPWKYWPAITAQGLRGHYAVVSTLLASRISQSVL